MVDFMRPEAWLFKNNLSIDLKLTEVPTTYTNVLHVQAINEFEDPIWEEHGERIPGLVRDNNSFKWSTILQLFYCRICSADIIYFLRTMLSYLYPREPEVFANL